MVTQTPQFLDETEVAQRWLHQFSDVDRSTAKLLLDSLLLVDSQRFERTLNLLIRRAIERHGGTSATALFSVLPRDAMEQVPIIPSEDFENLAPENRHLIPRRSVYFPQLDRDRPNAAGIAANKGSEATVATLLRDIAQHLGSSRVLDHPSIHSMRSTKCHLAILADDIVGSGDRASHFIDAFCRNKSIRSWISLGYIRIVVVAYAGTQSGVTRLKKMRGVVDVIVRALLPRGRSFWTDAQRRHVEALCKNYGNRTSRSSLALGYKNALTCLVFQHKCPNTVPAIVWSARKSPPWHPLFTNRPAFGDSIWPMATRPRTRVHAILRSAADPNRELRMMTLLAVARRRRSMVALADFLEVDSEQATSLLHECQVSGWVDSNCVLTHRGLRELQYAREQGLAKSSRLPLKPDPYYPRQLREVE